jgi:peptidoglycan hydrolase-like protein with peptidoglycan-binding domain
MAEIITQPYVPEFITVHLGAPDSDAQNVTVPFVDYIKNVASSEIYPTWSTAAIRANVIAQISYALNRVYLEYYRSRGYNFDITNSTAIDQSFVNGRNTFESIDHVVNDIFNTYIRREGFIEPLAAKYCNGTTSTCNGLSQWGSENLAQQGYNSVEILKYYYGNDIELVADAPVRPILESYPGTPLRRGSVGPYVRYIQVSLNRISENYPGIPVIDPEDAIFGEETEEAVKAFQRIFNLDVDGIVGRGTWYQMVLIYTGVSRLAELNSEGQQIIGYQGQPDTLLSIGDTGSNVEVLQYYLSVLSEFYRTVPPIAQTGIYDSETANAVTQAQQQFGLPQTGTVDVETWLTIQNAVMGIGMTVDSTQGV